MVSSGIFSTKSEVVTRGALSELAWNDPKGKFLVAIILSSKHSRKCKRFSIVIVNMYNAHVRLKTNDLSSDVSDGSGLK